MWNSGNQEWDKSDGWLGIVSSLPEFHIKPYKNNRFRFAVRRERAAARSRMNVRVSS